MSGHSHWAGIKHKKELTDQKRGELFSKLLNAVAIAGRQEPNPQFNPRLKAAIEKAKENKIPRENIERAIKRASENKNLEELIIEAYGPGGAAILIEAITDNKNRTIAEIKKILNENSGKWAEPGSVRWAFNHIAGQRGPDADSRGNWREKFKQEISDEARQKLQKLIEELLDQNETQEVYTNTDSGG